jgi:hypothetical protein
LTPDDVRELLEVEVGKCTLCGLTLDVSSGTLCTRCRPWRGVPVYVDGTEAVGWCASRHRRRTSSRDSLGRFRCASCQRKAATA